MNDLIDLSPLLRMLLLGALVAAGPLLWLWLRHRGAPVATRLRALTLLTLFLTFDLILFGAFTRLTDSGLGCPDWPGCYGSASPLGAREEIAAAQAALPTGPVTHGKAWVEMVHRYFATGVGALITVLMIATWAAARGPGARSGRASAWWATATFVWVCLQGAFGALTVTMKLYPLIVTLHLLGGVGLLALLAVQAQRYRPQPVAMSARLRAGVLAVLLLAVVQVALGGWVSTNYAVLACREFPQCHDGQWWPAMDFAHAFTLLRALGETGAGANLPFEALVAIHMTHRIGALIVFVAIGGLAWRLRQLADARAQRVAWALAALALWQLASGLSNVVLGWPMVAALAHTGGAAVLIALLAALAAGASPERTPRPTAAGPTTEPAGARPSPSARAV
jgi:heme a synthase